MPSCRPVVADRLVRVPEALDTRTAAAVMLQGCTAHYLTTSSFPLRAGHTALVHAGAGGAGRLIIQMAKKSRRKGHHDGRHARQDGSCP